MLRLRALAARGCSAAQRQAWSPSSSSPSSSSAEPALAPPLLQPPTLRPGRRVDPDGVFVVTELDLGSIAWLCFSFASALCVYTPAAKARLYALAVRELAERSYPVALLGREYDPSFAIRGLHLDKRNGVLLKLSSLHEVAVPPLLGRRRLGAAQAEALYDGGTLDAAEVAAHTRLLAGPFGAVEACVVADTLEALRAAGGGALHHPAYVVEDARAAVAAAAAALQAEVVAAPGAYVEDSPGLADLLAALRAGGRRLMLLTNSPWPLVDAAMRHMLRDEAGLSGPAEWTRLLDVVVVQAESPGWFTGDAPFRSLNTAVNKLRWVPVNELRTHHVYAGGSLAALRSLPAASAPGQPPPTPPFPAPLPFAPGRPHSVLCLSALGCADAFGGGGGGGGVAGDAFADLAAPRAAGWRTGAVLAELSAEVAAQASPAYRAALARLQAAELQQLQQPPRAGAAAPADAERLAARDTIAALLNPNFGSSFRTLTGHTALVDGVLRHADLYSASLANVLRAAAGRGQLRQLRRPLPHEPWVTS